MAANPALVRSFSGELLPAPFQGETYVLRRDGVEFEIDEVLSRRGKWHAKGVLYVSNVRLMFIANQTDESGLAAFDLPLVYVYDDKLNQPVFGCNNLSGKCWPAVQGGGPRGGLPPHQFKVLFKQGGIGTFYPLYYVLAHRAREASAVIHASAPQQWQQEVQQVQGLAAQAFVDPNDPTKVYLAQPVDESQRLQQPPRYAANYGQDEVYEPMGLRP